MHLGFLTLTYFPSGFPASEKLEIFLVDSTDSKLFSRSKSSRVELDVVCYRALLPYPRQQEHDTRPCERNPPSAEQNIQKLSCQSSPWCSGRDASDCLLYLDVEWEPKPKCTKLPRPGRPPNDPDRTGMGKQLRWAVSYRDEVDFMKQLGRGRLFKGSQKSQEGYPTARGPSAA